jgi:hypothetical protein
LELRQITPPQPSPNMTKKFTALRRMLLALALALGTGYTASAQIAYNTVALTAGSYTADVVANGLSQTSAGASTTASVDNNNYRFMEKTFSSTATANTRTQGLPVGGSFSSFTTSGLSFQLASYTGNNALRLTSTTTSGNLTFVTPQRANELYVLATAGNGPMTATMTVNFLDAGVASTQAFTSQTVPDWYNGAGTAFQMKARIGASSTSPETSTTNPLLYQIKLTIDPANTGKTITGIAISQAAGGGVITIMGVSAGVAPLCTGTPTASATSSVTGACSGTSFTLTAATPPAATAGLTYQWKSRPTGSGTAFANITTNATGTTSAVATITTQTVATDYQVVVTCSGSGTSNTSNTVAVAQNSFMNCYCLPPTNSAGEYLTNVTLKDINNTTGKSTPTATGYANYSASPSATQTTTLSQGGSYVVSVSAVAGRENSQALVWIDYNHNSAFDSPSELVIVGTVPSAPTTAFPKPFAFTNSITVPLTALTGDTHMRVRWHNDNTSTDACATNWQGETEDYLVTIGAATACAGTPAVTANAPAVAPCSGSTFTLTATGANETSGITYQWQKRTGTTAFASISGATSAALQTSQTVATDYQVIAACGGASVTSTPVTVPMGYLNCYCGATPAISNAGNEYVDSVAVAGNTTFTNGPTRNNNLAGISSASASGGNNDYTMTPGLTTVLNQGGTYPVTVRIKANASPSQGALWIDFDHSGTFDNNATEYYLLGVPASSGFYTYTVNVTVPANAPLGPTRLRVRERNSAFNGGAACDANGYGGETEDYLLTVGPPLPCTNPPATIAATGPANACANTPFTLTTSSIPVGTTNYTYQWYASTTGPTGFAPISGATTASYMVTGQLVPTVYRLTVGCATAGASAPVTSNDVSVGQNAYDQCYCSVTHGSGCSTYGSITNVSLNGMSNTTTCAGALPNYTVVPAATATTTLNANSSYTLNTTFASSASMSAGVWIDYDHNGTFDASEFTSISTSTSSATLSTTLAIPATALGGTTRMRIRTESTGVALVTAGRACDTFVYGETEDYTITIVAAVPCAGTPPTATATTSTSTVCPTGSFTLTASYAGSITGLSFQWQSRTGTNAFANITGATSLTYAVSNLATSTDYRFVITCANGGLTSASNELSVSSSFMNCYCKPPAQSNISGGEYLTNVTLGTINNSSTNPVTTPVGYSDYTVNPTATQTTALSRGGTYTISVSAQNNRQNSQAMFWIDYNHNGTFDGAPEYNLVGTGPSATTGYPRQELFTLQFTVPGTALLGATHLRVRWHNDNSSTDPCATDWYGETEEYIVNINADLVVSSTANVPAGTYSSITVTGPNGNATLTGAVTVSGAVTVQSGAQLGDGCQVLSGAGSFTAAAGSTLRICNAAGISASGATGAVQVTGARSFSADASYVYSGTVAQSTGTGLPATVLNLTVNNATGVTLTQSTSISRMLTLTSGNLRLGSSNLSLLSDATGTAMVVNTNGVVQNTGSGVAIMQRYATPSTGYTGAGYRHYSSPMAATPISELGTNSFTPSVNAAYNALPTPQLPANQFPNVFDYQESRLTAAYPDFTTGWHSPASTTEVLTPAKGYTVNIAPQLVDLSGSLNSGTINTGPLTTGATANSGWQLLGNPYPAPLDWNLVTAANAVPTGMDAAVYTYEPSSQYAGFYRSYVNGTGTTGFTGVMSAMQGFFVHTSQNLPAGFNFQNAYRLTSYANPAFYRTADTRTLLRLGLSGAAVNGSDEAVVYLQAGATATGTDRSFDAAKISNPSGLSLATQVAGLANEPLAVNALPLTAAAVETRLPLTVSVPAAGAYRFDVAALVNFDPSTAVLLLDHTLNTRTDLRQVSAYAFTAAQAGAQPGRFELLLGRPGTVTGTATALASQFSVWPNPATSKATLHVVLAAPAASATLTLRTLLGQAVSTQTFGGSSATLPTTGLAAGTYLLTVQVAGQATATRRVVVE